MNEAPNTTILAVLWMAEILLWIGVAFGVFLDVTSCRLWIRRTRTGGGPSGIPAVALVLFVLRLAVRPLDFFSRTHRALGLLPGATGFAILFHVACQLIVPRVVLSRGTRH